MHNYKYIIPIIYYWAKWNLNKGQVCEHPKEQETSQTMLYDM